MDKVAMTEQKRQKLIDMWLRRRESTVEEYINNRTVRQANGCLFWRGAKKNGPGNFAYNNMFTSANACICIYQVRKGPIPLGKILRHTCDDSRCVEIAHLIPGTKKDNRQDFMERHPRAMEICIAAAKIAGKGTKKMWDNFTPEQRAEFINMRSDKYKEKYPSGSDFYKKRATNIWKTRRENIQKQKDLVVFVKYSDELLDNT